MKNHLCSTSIQAIKDMYSEFCDFITSRRNAMKSHSELNVNCFSLLLAVFIIYSQLNFRVNGQWTIQNFVLVISLLMIVNIELYV